MIKFINISKKITANNKALFTDVNFQIDKGDFVFLIGDSGTGKSTILKMLYRDKKPDSGKILIDGIDIVEMDKSELPMLRRRMGIIFQEIKLLKKKNVRKNISYALEVIGEDEKEIETRLKDVLKFISLEEKEEECIEKLSVGEKQRVAIARSIINNPDIILCDEITGNLDKEKAEKIMRLLRKLNKGGTTIIFATHNRELIEDFPNTKVLHVNKGVVKNEF